MTAGARPGGASGQLALPVAMVALAALAATVGVLRNGWTMDAGIDILFNRWVTDSGHLAQLLTGDYLAGSAAQSGYWRPLLLLVYWVVWRAGGGQAVAFFALNIVLHTGLSIGIVHLARRLQAAPRAAVFAGLLFAVHPVHCDVTAMVVGLKDLLAAAGFAGGLLLLLAARTASGPPAGWLTAGGVAAHLAGLLAKESALALLPALLALDLLVGTARGASRTLLGWQYGGLVAGLAVKFGGQSLLLGGTVEAIRINPIDNPLNLLSGLDRSLHALALIPFYGRLALWPVHLSVDYSYNALPVRPGLLQPAILVGAAAVVALVGLIGWQRRRQPFLVAGLAILGVTYLPISNLVVPIGTNAAERFFYIPSIGACLVLAWLLTRAAIPPRAAWVAVSVLAAAGLVQANIENGHRRSNLSLWESALKTAPKSLKASLNCALQLQLAGRGDEALRVLDAALAQDDDSPVTRPLLSRFRPRLRAASGVALTELGRFDEALSAFQAMFEAGGADAEARLHYVNLLARRGEFAAALTQLDEIARLPLTTIDRDRLERLQSQALAGMGRGATSQAPLAPPPSQADDALREQIQRWRTAIAERPADPFLRFELSDLLFRAGDLPSAIDALESGLQLQPSNLQARANLGILQSEAGRLDDAERTFRDLVNRAPDDPMHSYNLAVVLLKAGRPQEAREELQRALALLPAEAPLRRQVERMLGETAR